MQILVLLQLVALAGEELWGSGSGYDDANGNLGYGNASWKYDP